MGKRRKKGDGAPAQPMFQVKKQKLAQETRLTALVALHKYAHKFKLGAPGFREKGADPYVITVVMNGSELGTAQHGDKEAAMEKASLITLHLLDPDGKSIVANIHHHDEAELKRLCAQITNAKQDEIKALAQSAAAAPIPTTGPMGAAFGAFPGGLAPTMPLGYPMPYGMTPMTPFGPVPVPQPPFALQPIQGQPLPGGAPPAATAPADQRASVAPLPPLASPEAPRLAPPAGAEPEPPKKDEGPHLIWQQDSLSPEECRAALARYQQVPVPAS